MELQYFFHDDGTKERHADILLGMELRYASEVECAPDCQPDVLPAHILKFHYAVIQFYRTAVCPMLPGTAQNLFTFFQIICFFSIFPHPVTACQRSVTMIIFRGFCPAHCLHTLPIWKNVLPPTSC